MPFSDVSAEVFSECDPLRQVLVHEPGTEIERVTPDTYHEHLFGEVLWPRRAREEHRAFVATLQDRGVDVVHLTDRLEHLAKAPTGQRSLVESIVDDAHLPPRAGQWLHGWLDELPAPELVRTAIAGCVNTEVPAPRESRWWWGNDRHSVVAPLANQMFVRDSSFKIGSRPVLARMRERARRRETALLRIVYEHDHPPGPIQQPTQEAVSLEGGDVAVLDDRVIAVGISTRTSPSAVIALADHLGSEITVIAVELPRRRATMHLDTVMTMLDASTVLADQVVIEAPVTVVKATSRRVFAEQCVGLVDALRRASGEPMKVIHPPQGNGAAREQWDGGCNVLALAPGVVVAYASNESTNRHLDENGIEVLTIEGSELRRARGGPRCLSCPWARESLT